MLPAYSIEGNQGHRLKDPRHRLAVVEYETGKTVHELHLPPPAMYASIAVAEGAVYVVIATQDGSVTCMR